MSRIPLKQRNANQLWWVVSLLAVAVILPTVCLLWFMTQAVNNERLAVRKKLEILYGNRLATLVQEKLSDEVIASEIALQFSDGFLVYDRDGNMTFPVADMPEEVSSHSVFAFANELEYKNLDPNQALGEYHRIAQSAEKDILRIYADISQARCLRKLDRRDEAIAALRATIAGYDDHNPLLRTQIGHARLLLLELCHPTGSKDFVNDLADTFDYALFGMAEDDTFAFLGREPNVDKYIPSALQVFMLQKCVAYAQELPEDSPLKRKYIRARWLVEAVATSIQAAERYPKADFADPEMISSQLVSFNTQKPLYGVYQRINDYLTLMIFTPQHLASRFKPFLEDMQKIPSECCIYDEKGVLVAGPRIERPPFIKMPLKSGYLAGWTVALYIDDSAFETAARRQQMVYSWTAVLIIVLMAIVGATLAGLVLREAKLNRLKNDFIATITHELKTPLASMRVLVDTLLEGRCDNEGQKTEYLELIARENLRLSRLIDNFLTFSRMERHKQAFDMVKTAPAEIAQSAVEAVRTKFNHGCCQFTVTLEEYLPAVMADKDALVTVLVNLLDNACKYSYDEKHIALSVFQEDRWVCFRVKDSGIGMTRRQMRKIFDRFYQADTSLARRVEGAGLGLAIVKFIVEAHKGKITVDSKLGNGSVFEVKMPKT